MRLLNRFVSFSVPFCLLVAAGCSTTAPAQRSAGSAAAVSGSASASYGLSNETAVEVCKPAGERKYIQRLRCGDGSVPTFERRGSGGSRTPPKSAADEEKALEQMFRDGPLAAGEIDYHVIDFYQVRCDDQVTELVMDMYHCNQEEPAQAPPGFTIVPPR